MITIFDPMRFDESSKDLKRVGICKGTIDCVDDRFFVMEWTWTAQNISNKSSLSFFNFNFLSQRGSCSCLEIWSGTIGNPQTTSDSGASLSLWAKCYGPCLKNQRAHLFVQEVSIGL